MATDCIAQLGFSFQGIGKKVLARFDAPGASSDGGALLLKAIDDRLGLTRRLTETLTDRREEAKVRHTFLELVRERVFGIACGYADTNDAARLAEDPIHKILAGRDPVAGDPLASQPTLSRFENGVGREDLFRMALALSDTVIETQRKRRRGKARRITIDLDTTDDPTHGQQELAFFNGHYGTWCYLPLLAFVTFDREAEEHLVAAILRPGNARPMEGTIGLLRRLLGRLRDTFPKAIIRVRLDGGFCGPEILDFLEAQKVEYIVAMAENARLARRALRLMGRARVLSRDSGESERVFGETLYAAKTWSHRRRVIIKAEVVRLGERDPKNNPRFVVTNLRQSPERVYEIYRGRGEIENRIKELHLGLEIDRTSSPNFLANQFRVLLTAAAYVLFQEMRRGARGTSLAKAQVWTLRERLLKLAAWVGSSVRRIVFHLPVGCPWSGEWRRVALAAGASTG